MEYLKKNYDLRKDDSLKKYEIKFEEIKSYATKIENIQVASPEVLLILKQGAELEREDSVKGSKNRIDIMALLLFSEIDFKKYNSLLEKHNLNHCLDRLFKTINNFDDINYLDLNPREFKLKKRELLRKLGKTN